MARITVEDCLAKVGDKNRFALINLAVSRVKQHRKGKPLLVTGKNKELVMTLREIAAGKVNFDNIQELKSQPLEIETGEEETPSAQTEELKTTV